MSSSPIRWRLDGDDGGRPALFDEEVECHPGTGEFRGMEFFHVRAKRVINEVPAASRMPFRFTINAYRGCSHACVFCFARPTHEYLDMNAGEDFEKRIVVKINAVERLRAELASKRWQGDHIAMGTNTDPYQRCEGKYRLTRGIIKELGAAANPFSILTKGTLILRDLDVLTEAAKKTDVRASFSIGTLDEQAWRTSEPGTPHPRKRVEAVAKLNEAGIPCGVLVAPILPGISDAPEQIEEVVKAVLDAGAVSVSAILLHLRKGVREQYLPWLEETRPDLVEHYVRMYRGAYAPKSEQEKVSKRVAAMRRKHGGVPPTPPTSHPDARVSTKPAKPAPPPARQLPLGL